MTSLLEAVEATLHRTNPDLVHRHYRLEDCPYCPPLKRISAMALRLAAEAAERLSTPTSPNMKK